MCTSLYYRLLLCYYTNNVLIRYYMTQAYPLRDMPRARTPDQCVFERVFQRAVDLIADIFNRRVVPHYECFTEIRVYTLSV